MTYTARLAQTAVDLGNDPDFTKLEPLFSKSRIVLLGEQDHGDGATFAFKSKLVEHLHLRHGYNVLAFEADFYALARAWDEARTPSDVRTHVLPHVYSFWSRSRETAALWAFIEARFSSARPLVVAGLDPRPTGVFAFTDILEELDALLFRAQAAPVRDYPAFRRTLSDLLEYEYRHTPGDDDKELFFSVLEQFQLLFVATPQGPVWPQELVNLEYTAHNAWGWAKRDEGMAANLEWLARRRPDEKIIVWAHNYHVAKHTALIVGQEKRRDFRDTILGEKAAARLPGVCSLGFFSAEGWYHPKAYVGDLGERRKLDLPLPDSLEAHLLATGLEHAFLDLRAPPTEAFTMSSVGHHDPTEAPWADAFDGMFFIRTVHGLL